MYTGTRQRFPHSNRNRNALKKESGLRAADNYCVLITYIARCCADAGAYRWVLICCSGIAKGRELASEIEPGAVIPSGMRR